MIKSFIIERRSWITLVLSLQLLNLFIAYIDTSLPFRPMAYIVFLSLLIFILFLIIRYHRETKFYRSLVNRENNLDITNIEVADLPFEKIMEESIIQQTEQLKQIASDNLISLEQEKDELLAWIHEVKTPLTAMHLMIDRIHDKEIRTGLTYEWLRVHLLLDQQLHQKRIPFIENDLYMEKVDLEEIVIQEVKTLQSWCIQKGVGFDIDIQVTEIISDAKWIAFIFRQLLTNAVKYSEASDIIIKSYLYNKQTVFEVKDYGRGIDAKDLPRIFDKGFTSTTKHHDTAATGMGLYLTKKVTESLLININVVSEIGVGTICTLTFPNRNSFVASNSM
ncbi:sensor histidine kinase [Aquibacillus rhizosphaerae]|uniref:histidine kinase n=1 Tax=Aquibacillus rhizosphaerae TaxID=3051431 RepID=A0ABT7L8G7_9BACI|nr:sensor histidine kinase [Aquibacillus sp. LR5S19]MDL4840861.1 sensor histidine kinase [Aquibacillus sp. LR5S19]